MHYLVIEEDGSLKQCDSVSDELFAAHDVGSCDIIDIQNATQYVGNGLWETIEETNTERN